MNHMKQVAEMLGVELEEEFEVAWGNGVHTTCKITQESGFAERLPTRWVSTIGTLEMVLLGKAKIYRRKAQVHEGLTGEEWDDEQV